MGFFPGQTDTVLGVAPGDAGVGGGWRQVKKLKAGKKKAVWEVFAVMT